MLAPVAYGSNEGCGIRISSPGSNAASAISVISSSAPLPTTIRSGEIPRPWPRASRSAPLPPSGYRWMLAASRRTASIARGEAPSGFSLADRRTSSASPSSATSISRGLPASYGVTASTAARQILRTAYCTPSAQRCSTVSYRSNSASSLTLIAPHWNAPVVMPSEIYRRARRAEAGAARAEDRRRRRLDFFRGALTEGLDTLKQRHADGASGEDLVRTHAGFMDGVIVSLSELVSADAAAAGLTPTPFVVVALGGYGRGELHPSSDIDLMIVYDGDLTPYVQRVMQELLYTLWDLGLQVGHSLRSLEDCVAMARTDFPSRTSMQEARLVVGDKKLFARFGRVLHDNVYRHDFEQFLATTLAEREQRYRKHGASPYIGEPNIKESAGGLRDMHTAMWLGAAKFGARTLRELSDRGLITPHEQEAADRALTFLWRVRNELHFFSGHKNDVLSRELQPRIAKNLGYENDGDALGVERFMRDYYLNARVIHRVSKRLIARCHETLAVRGSAERRQRQQALADGLVFFDGRLHRADRDPEVLRRDPVRLMKVFWHLHRLGCDLSLGLERAVEESLDVVDDAFRRSPAVRD